MFGVVLWSDQIRNRAVIWCEDHGDLAFFKGDGVSALEGANMDPGDLVQFDVCRERHMRLARNPRLVASDEYPTLARDLKQVGDAPTADALVTGSNSSAKIIAFDPKPANSRSKSNRAQRAV